MVAGPKLAHVWDALRSDIELSLTGQKHEGKPQDTYQGQVGPDPGSRNFDDNGAIADEQEHAKRVNSSTA